MIIRINFIYSVYKGVFNLLIVTNVILCIVHGKQNNIHISSSMSRNGEIEDLLKINGCS